MGRKKSTLPNWASKVHVNPFFGWLDHSQTLTAVAVSSLVRITVFRFREKFSTGNFQVTAGLTFCFGAFELHLYSIVRNDVRYYGKWGMNYEFVYSGTPAGKEIRALNC